MDNFASQLSRQFKIPKPKPILDEINWLGRGDPQFSNKLWRLWETDLSQLNDFILIGVRGSGATTGDCARPCPSAPRQPYPVRKRNSSVCFIVHPRPADPVHHTVERPSPIATFLSRSARHFVSEPVLFCQNRQPVLPALLRSRTRFRPRRHGLLLRRCHYVDDTRLQHLESVNVMRRHYIS
jgi:hypothetical protein